MLDHAQVVAHLERITYKPGWNWNLHHDQHEGPYVRFLVDVPDTYGGGTTTLGINSWLPPMADIRQLEAWMLWRIARIENHEAREFLKRDGRIIFDPHAQERAA